MTKTFAAVAVVVTLALADNAPAQQYRYPTWQSTPGSVVYQPQSYYYAQPTWYYQTHWIYNYLPYGYGANPYGWNWGATYGAPLTNAYTPSNPSREYGPPVRSRSALNPAIPYSELIAEEQREASEDRGYIIVQVPTADTKIWIEGQLMSQKGLERMFMTPPLAVRGRTYSFEIRAEIPVKGFPNDPRKPKETLFIKAGQTKTVTFELEN